MQSQDQRPKTLDQIRSMMHLHHYSIHTERPYVAGIKRYIVRWINEHYRLASTALIASAAELFIPPV